MTTREQIKAWFKKGSYPKAEHFYAWIDSFYHKNDQIPIGSVENLPEQLNSKYPSADGQALERDINKLGTEVFQDRQANIAEFKRVDEELEEITAQADGLTVRLGEHEEANRISFEQVAAGLETLDNAVEENGKGIESLRQTDLQHSQAMQEHEQESTQQFESIKNALSFLSTENDQLREQFEALEQGSRYIKQDEKGMPNGIATLNPVGRVPASQIPKDLKIMLLDTYMSDSVEYASTAAAVYRLYQYFQADRREVQNEIAALEDLLKDSRELGVSPQSVFVSGIAQERIIYVKTSGTWTVEGLPDWISANTNGTGNGIVLLAFSANMGEEERTGTITILNQYGAGEEVSIAQEARVISYEHVLSVEPDNLIVTGAGTEQQLTVVSKRNTLVNGVFEQQENINYLLSTDAGWITIDGNTITIAGNPSDTTVREATLTITQDIEGGKTVEVPILQGTGIVEYQYSLSVTPESFSFTNTGETKAFTVVSTKQKLVNGKVSGAAETVETSNLLNAVGFSLSGNNVTASENQTEVVRTGTVTITQAESNKRAVISLNQAAGVVTWEYALSISPTSLSFAGSGETQGFSVVSTKQKKINGVDSGGAVAVAYTPSCSGTGFSPLGNNVVAASNQTEEARTGTLTVAQAESGKTVTASLSQAAGVVTWEYALSISPTSLSFAGSGETQGFSVVSTKQKKINGVDSGGAVAVAYTPSCSGSGFSPSGNNVVAEANPTEAARAGTLTVAQAESGKTVTASLSQAAGVVTWEYALSISPTSLGFAGSGETQGFSVVSTKQKKINGVDSGGAVAVAYTPSCSGAGFSPSGNNVVAEENQTEAARTGTLTIAQAESGKTVTASLSQSGSVVTWEYTFTVAPTAISFIGTGESRTIIVISTKQKKVNGVNSGDAVEAPYTSAITSGGGFSVQGKLVTATLNNSADWRQGTLTVTQPESGKTAVIYLEQEAGSLPAGMYFSQYNGDGGSYSITFRGGTTETRYNLGDWSYTDVLIPRDLKEIEFVGNIPQIAGNTGTEIYIEFTSAFNVGIGSLAGIGCSLNSSWNPYLELYVANPSAAAYSVSTTADLMDPNYPTNVLFPNVKISLSGIRTKL